MLTVNRGLDGKKTKLRDRRREEFRREGRLRDAGREEEMQK